MTVGDDIAEFVETFESNVAFMRDRIAWLEAEKRELEAKVQSWRAASNLHQDRAIRAESKLLKIREALKWSMKMNSYWYTYVEVDGEEVDNVKVYYSSSPQEKDVGWPGGLEIESVMKGEDDLLGRLTTEEVDSLQERTDEYLVAQATDERY